ncbi:MAG: ATP-binding protein [Bdellovibrionota bacterium]
MKLDENTKRRILELWEKKVRVKCPEIRGQPRIELLDHLPQFIDRLFAALRKEEHHTEMKRTEHVSKIHGNLRSKIEDYSLAEVLREYSILRLAVIEILSEDHILSAEEQNIIHILIDEAEVVAGTEFSESRILIAECLNEELKRSNAELERFAAIAAHDLRSPIATIIGFIDIIQDGYPNPSDQTLKSFKAIQSSGERMLLLIERLLAYAQLGHETALIKDVNLNEAVYEVETSLAEDINKGEAKLIYDNLPTIQADPMLVHQLLQNLIGNSLKFKSKNPSVIKIEVESEDEDKWTISVQDNGIGFDDNHSKSIFEPFKRLNSTKEYQGSGLGLATVKRVVSLLGGEIWCESKIGEGAKFIFTILKKTK